MPTPHSNDFHMLWKFARSGDEVKVRELIEDSAAVARNLLNLKHHRKGTTPLMEAAACRCNEPIVSELIAAGADVNAVDDTKLKNTALHYAAKTNRDPLVVETLLEAGADPYAVNRKGFMPLDIARQKRRKAVGAVLLNAMKVHAGWLFLRGKFRWNKRWGVVVACNKQRTSTELCVFRQPGDLRPLVVMLIDEAARMTQFPSTDSYSWLQRNYAFVFDKPVMCHRVKREKFTRSPICKKTMSLDDVRTLHYVFAADSLNNLTQWRRVLQSTNFDPREARSSVNRSSLIESQSGELYYWPQELVENLRSTVLREQEQQRQGSSELQQQQKLGVTPEHGLPVATAGGTFDQPAGAPAQLSTVYRMSEEDEAPPDLLERAAAGETGGRSAAVRFASPHPVDAGDQVPSVAAAPHLHTGEHGRASSNVSIVSGSEPEATTGPEVASGTVLLPDSKVPQPRSRQSNQEIAVDEEDGRRSSDLAGELQL
ncbi:unnamed protein product [Hyaloperonospora brassicae]|uniref:PH domain-containing protein n=1 Tax=Hyaloperonospora brassicae TaxID=162125 RepID=A0AAV0T6T0_HYABA|nr:unnamed protein product [Hyaloperonospora brassicae]